MGLDLIGPYLTSLRHRCHYYLVIIDCFSNGVEIIPLKRTSAKSVTTSFFNEFISKYGTPLQGVSDNGGQFVNDLFHRLEMFHTETVPYRPEANMAERVLLLK